MSTIIYRKLDATGDPLQGNGQANFVSDLDAVAQAISTRLKLFAGEWWENGSAGLQLFQQMLGVSGSGKHPDAIAMLITRRILGTPYVNSVANVATSFDAATRAFSFSCDVATAFGALAISNIPQPAKTLLASAPVTVTPNLSAPTSLVLSAGGVLSWAAQAGVTSFNVKRSLVSGKGYTTIGTSTGLTFTDLNPPAGVTSYYVITAVAQGMESPISNEVNSTLINLLLSPNDLTNGSIWLLSPGVAIENAVTIDCSTGEGGSGVWQTNIAVGTSTSYTASVTIAGSAAAGNVALNISDASFNYIAGTSWTPLTSSQQTLTFTFNSGSTTNLIFKIDADSGTDGLMLTVTGASLDGPPPGTPAAPTGLSASDATSAGATLTWTAVAGASSYNILRTTTPSLSYSWVNVGTVSGSSTTYTDASASVTVGTTLYYVVEAVAYGAASAASNQASIATVASVALNILPNAADITNPTWSTSSGTTALSATTLQLDASGSGLYQSVSVAENSSYTASVIVAGSGMAVSLGIYDSSFNYITYSPAITLSGSAQTISFNFSTGTNTTIYWKLDVSGSAGVLTLSMPALIEQVVLASSAATQIYNDMVGANEAEPHGMPSDYGFYLGGAVSMGNDPAGNAAIEWWGGLYVNAAGNPATNTQVNVKNCTVLWLRASTGQWELGCQTNALSGSYYAEDFVGDATGQITFTTLSDGTQAFLTTEGSVGHFYGPWPRISIDPNDVGGVICYCEARLVLINSAGTDDRSTAAFVLDFGADYYPGPESAGSLNNPGVGGGKFKIVETNWRSFAFTTMTSAQLALYPPPIDFTGINA